MKPHSDTRRRFLVAAITLTGTAVIGPLLTGLGKAWAGGDHDALIRMTRLLYPHERIDDKVYAEVLDQAMGMVAGDQGFEKLLADANRELNASIAGNFMVASPTAQIAALQAVQDQPYFAAIQGAVSNRLYSHEKIWNMLNYAGPSYQQGGYIDRGAGDIDWLPEADP
jgi:hypothetical protein